MAILFHSDTCKVTTLNILAVTAALNFRAERVVAAQSMAYVCCSSILSVESTRPVSALIRTWELQPGKGQKATTINVLFCRTRISTFALLERFARASGTIELLLFRAVMVL
jgi:hypothetical protein